MSAALKHLSYLSELRSLYHSLNTEERFKSIQALAEQKTSDSTRELIHVFNECGWRETKFQIIKSLVAYPDLRCLEFLFEQASQSLDLPIAEAAVQALGESKSIWAARFLSEFYKHGHESLKPACVLALGKLSDRRLLKLFLEDLNSALKNRQTLLVKNLVLTIGELKAHQAIPDLIDIAKNKHFRDVALSAVVSLGKIAKDVSLFDGLENYFKNDSFEYQIFNNAKNQCQFRSDWKLEDYLNKLIKQGPFHQALLLEFNSFRATDVKAALDMLADDEHSSTLFKVLGKLEFKEIKSWYAEYQHLVNEKNNKEYLNSLSAHHNPELVSLIEKHHDLNSESFLKALFLNSDKPEDTIRKIMLSEDFLKIDDQHKIQVLNIVYKYVLALKPNEKVFLQCCKILESYFYDFEKNKLSAAVSGRIIRLFSQLGFNSHKLSQIVFSQYHRADLRKSVHLYFEHNVPDYFYTEFLKKPEYQEVDLGALIKIFTVAKENCFNEKKLESFFKLVLLDKTDDLQILFLKLIAKFKPVQYKEHVLKLAKNPDYIIQFHVILALRAYYDETLADQLAIFLNSKSKSISGRTLDALLSLPGNRAKRLVFDYFMDHHDEPGVAEKIVRSFKPPENDTDYFTLQTAKIIQSLEIKEKNSTLLESLKEFKDQLNSHQKSFSNKISIPTDADILAIDQEIEKIIPAYVHFDETSKSALRSAEVPFKHPELFDHFVDKSSIVLGYSKAIDIVLEKQLGRKILFPKLESKLNEFQNVVHSLSLNEDHPNSEKVLKLLQLEKHFSAQSLPVHKMGLMAQGIMNSKILNEHHKILDGLRAWGIMLLVFARKSTALSRPLIAVVEDENNCVLLAKKLMWLQDVRNPIAHRQTVVDFKDVELIRTEVFHILRLMNKVLFS